MMVRVVVVADGEMWLWYVVRDFNYSCSKGNERGTFSLSIMGFKGSFEHGPLRTVYSSQNKQLTWYS